MKKGLLIAVLLAAAIVLAGCTNPPVVCGNGTCEAGENQQNCPKDCSASQDNPESQNHLECQNQQCAQVQGAGTNRCSTDTDCEALEEHFECQNQACTQVQGSGANQCTTNADCQSCEPPQEQVVKDKMVWDLPQLCGFTYNAWDWQPDSIDLRYISPADNDQHSEYFLRSFNSPEEANTFFDNLINSAPTLWTVSIKEINGNKIYEGTAAIPIGEQRYSFWVSGNNVLQGWNGNDLGTITDDALFSILTEEYLEKYPSNVS